MSLRSLSTDGTLGLPDDGLDGSTHVGESMEIIKHALKSRTMQFALALAVFGVIETQIHLFSQFMSPEVFGLFNVLIAVIVAALRVITTVPLKDR
jgi:hypothetical protein